MAFKARPLLLLALLLLANLAWANKRDYARGVEAAGSGDWARVQQLMSNALADDAEPKDRALMYGTYRRPYIPQYYLALAALNRDDCAAAVRLLDDSRLSTLLATGGRAAAEATEIGAIRRRCATPLSGQTSSAASSAAASSAPAATLSAAQQQSAQRALAELQRASTQARDKLPVQTLSTALTAAGQAQAALDNAVQGGDAAALQRALQQAGAATRELDRLSAAASPVVVASSSSASSSSAAAPVQAPAAPAAGLRVALDAFLSGDYQTVLRANTAGMDPRSAAHTLLLRAAARYSLHLLGGAQDARLLTQAQADIREARRLLPALRAPAAYFSPRFLRLFEQTR